MRNNGRPAVPVVVPCPRSDCDRTVPVRKNLFGGVYPCRCGGCRLRLLWVKADGQRTPTLKVAP